MSTAGALDETIRALVRDVVREHWVVALIALVGSVASIIALAMTL